MISDKQRFFCDKEVTLIEFTQSLEGMNSEKTPGNDGLTVEFYKCFWKELQIPFLNSYFYSLKVGKLSTSQRQAIIKLLEKREKDKRYLANWRPISLLNVDTKIISKAIANKLKLILPSIISNDQTAYVQGRFIGESTRLISDILEITDSFNIGGYILTADIEKAFDSMDHIFLLAVLKKIGFGNDFIDLIKMLLKDNESCVLNGGVTSKYFSLQRGARQGDPIAAYLFIIAIEIFYIMVRSDKRVKGLEIFDYTFLLSAYADDTTFFVKDIKSIHIIFEIFDSFSAYSGFKLNKSKCELSGIGVKKGVNTALCNVENVNLATDSVRILGVHYSYNNDIFQDKNFLTIINKIENVLKLWKMRSLTIGGKITIFKTLAISKIVYIAHMSAVPECVITHLEKIHKDFIWNNKKSKIKHSTLISDYSFGGLRDIDIKSKIKALQLSWIKRLYDSNFHPWKIIPMHILSTVSERNIFYPNLSCNYKTTENKFPKFYKNIIKFWCEISSNPPITASSILSEKVFNNNFIQIDKKVIESTFFNIKDILLVTDLFDDNGDVAPWEDFKKHHNIHDKMYFKWVQIIKSIPEGWRKIIKIDKGRSRAFCELSPHITFKASTYTIDKLTSQTVYKIFISKLVKESTSQKHILKILQQDSLPWKDIYNLPRIVTIDTYTRIFQYKCLNGILYLNNSLYKMKLSDTPLCPYCQVVKETISHLFHECKETKKLWNQIKLLFKNVLQLPAISLQSAIIGFRYIKR